MTNSYQSKRARSPSYPSVSLPVAIERAERLYERERRAPAPVAAVLAHWGYSPKSGPGFTTLATVKQFGLVEDEGRGDDRRIRLSELGLRIVQDRRPGSVEREGAIQEAALRPAIYSDLWRRFGAEASDENLTYALVRKGFSESAAADVVQGYRATVAFANLVARDSAEPEPENETADGDDDESRERGPEGGRGEKPRKRSSMTFVVPIAVNADPITVEGDFPLSESQWRQFMAVLTAMKPGLVAHGEEADSSPDSGSEASPEP